ncbi:MAG: porin [Alphaproteobacteria bacterium]|nr:porin [Alphaproteobacteria bacterium]
MSHFAEKRSAFRKALLVSTVVCSALGFSSARASDKAGAELSQAGAELSKEIAALQQQISELNKKVSTMETVQKQSEETTKQTAIAAARQEVATTAKRTDMPATNAKPWPVGYISIPGTSSAVKIGGFARGDVVYENGPQMGDALSVGNIPLKGINAAASKSGNTSVFARASRINFATTTQTARGDLNTFIEIDFFGGNAGSTYQPRLRHAYGEYMGVLAGHTATVFGDQDSLGTNIDINGINNGTMRQPQVRYTMNPAQSVKLMVALERPVTDYTSKDGALSNAGNMFGSSGLNASGTTNGTNAGTTAVPDVTAQVKWTGSAGHVALRGVARQLAVKYVTEGSSTPTTDYSAKATAWGMGIGGRLVTVGKSGVFGQINGGDGIGRYIYDLDGQAAYFDVTQRKFETQRAYNGIVGYEHYWQDNLRTNLMASYTRVHVSDFSPGMPQSAVSALSGTTRISNQFKKVMGNIIYSPVNNMDVGVELGWFKRQTIDGKNGQAVRTQVALTYKF